MRVLVCGGRTFSDVELLYSILDALKAQHPDMSVIHGAAAGPVRNGEMLSRGKPDVVIAFPGGRGTANMCEQAMTAGVRVVRVG